MKAFTTVTLVVVAGLGTVAAAADLTKQDQVQIAVQAICPVSGEKLGEHGPPVKVAIGEQKEQIFYCCQDCLQKKIDPQHWATIHANFAKAQRICPVMKKQLPARPKWTIAEGRVIFVCCPPCTKKIEADPQAFIQQVDQQYAASLKDRQQVR